MRVVACLFALAACGVDAPYPDGPTLSLTGSWSRGGDVWHGVEQVAVRGEGDSCTGERTFAAVPVDPACETCTLSLQVTAVDDSGWCVLDEEADIISNGFVIFRPDPLSGEGWVLVAASVDGVWTPYASGVSTVSTLVYDHAEPAASGGFAPSELRALRGPPTTL